jgi:outer membrane protein insertion porin family
MKTMRALLVLLVLILPAAAQRPSRAKPKPVATQPGATINVWPLASLTVTGNNNYSAEDILRVAAMRVGQNAGKDEFEAARQRLLDTGLFETVGFRFDPAPGDAPKIAGVFEVREIGQVYPFRTEELPVDRARLEAWLKEREPLFAPKVPATEQVIQRYSRHVEELLAKQGKPAKVRGRLVPESGDLEIVFLPASLPAVAEIDFRGNKSIDKQTLQRAAAGAGVGAVYTEHRFRQVLDTSVRPLYEAQGRLRVKFGNLTTAPSKGVEGIAVTVDVDEGPVYSLANVDLTGVPGAKDLLKAAKFKTGEPANFTEIEESIDRIRRELRRAGHIRPASKTERRYDDTAKSVELALHIDPGPQFTMGKLTIEGLDIQTEPAVRKLWALKEGQAFNGEYPDFFLRRLREDHVFENLGKTHAEVKADEKTLRADVKLVFGRGTDLQRIGPDVEEKPRQN